MKVSFSLGSDPELFLVRRLPDGTIQFVSAIGKVPGTKENMLSLGNGHFAFHDNVLAECCPHYGVGKKEAVASFGDCFRRYAKVVHPFLLRPQASCYMPKEECMHPAAQEFGCSAEMNCYDMATVNPPKCEAGNTFRSGGGHIHLGFVKGDPYPLIDVMGRWWLTRVMDLFVGLPSVLMDTDPTSQARRKLYGGAGNMRPKEYGIEYRTLGNFWLSSPRHVGVIHDLCQFVVGFMQKDESHQDLWVEHADVVREAINNGDVKKSTALWSVLSGYLPNALSDEVKAISELEQPDFYEAWGIKAA